MGKSAILSVRILSDAAGAKKGMAETETGLEKMGKTAGKMAGVMAAAGAAAGAALTKGLMDAIDGDQATRKLAGQMGLGAGEMAAAGEMGARIYRGAWGESLEEVNTAIGSVGSTLADMGSNGGADVERLSKKALDLSSTFGIDVTEAVSTAGALMKNGLAADGDEAFDLLVGSMQKMPTAMQSELFPILDEYSKHFADLGIDGTTALGMVSMASQDGAIGMDKLGDSLKELTIRATDMSPATQGAYEAMGLSMDDMTAKFLAGGDQASEAFGMVVGGLQQITDPAAQSAAAIALFGTPLEDLGTAGIPDFLGAIDPMGDAFDSVAGAADRLSETVNTGPAAALETFKREALGSLQDTAAGALPYIEPLLSALGKFTPIIGPLAVALVVMGTAIGIVTGAMAIFNAVAALNPIGLIVIAVVALIAGLVVAYNNIGWFKDAVNLVGQIAGQVFGAIVAWVSNVVTWFMDVIVKSQTFQAMIDLLGAYFSLLGTLAQVAWDLIVTGVTAAVDWVKSITTENQTFMDAMGTLGEIGKAAFGAIDTAISTTIGWVKDAVGWFQNLFGAKNDAAAADAGAGAGGRVGTLDAQALAAPRMMRMAAVDPLALAYSAPGAASYAGTSAYSSAAGPAAGLVATINRSAAAAPVTQVTNHVKVTFTGVVTDKVGTAREIRKLLDDESALTGRS